MKPTQIFGCLGLMFACAHSVHAADRTLMLPLQAAIDAATAAGKLDGSVKFYLADTGPQGRVVQSEVVTNRKTNAFGKTDQEACEWAAQSAVISLQDAAKNAGANAVVNIVSFYKRNVMSDSTNYECHAGAIIGGVALRGDLIVAP